jgi:DNA ligase-1
MQTFAETADAIAGTTSKLKKIGFLAAYLKDLPEDDLRAAAVFFTGRPFPLTDARTLNVGWSALMNAIQQISNASDAQIHDVYLARGDLGEMAERLLAHHHAEGSIPPTHVQSRFSELVTISGSSNKMPAVLELLRALSPAETKYVVKIITGDLRIGLKENTVEEAIAKAFERPVDAVRRANMALGDIGQTAVLAKRGELDDIALTMFRPVKFMLATPAETEDEIFATLSGSFYVEDKYDGIRGQLHASGARAREGEASIKTGRAALYSRTLDEVGHQFPEIIEAAQRLDDSLIVDGEIVGFKNGQVLPFASLQKRLGRKRPSAPLIEEVPVSLMIFDILVHSGRSLIDEPLISRKKVIESIQWIPPLHVAPFMLLEGRVELEPFFEQAARRRNEGLMLKDAKSFYLPGKRGMSWLKWKKTLATLDVVVTGVEFGHGRRRDVLSDYTFAVQHDGKLLNIGKAYSGLTDLEIAEMTEYFKKHTIQDFGRFRIVEPNVVIEVAFNGIQRSERHSSGYALRFPRIVRIRTDKPVSQIDTIATVDKIYRQHVGETG